MNQSKGSLNFSPTLEEFASLRSNRSITVLSGSNNSGKSLVLKSLKRAIGRSAYLMGANRFYHVYHFGSGIRDPNQLENFERQFEQNFDQEQYNHEQNHYDLNSVIQGFTTKQLKTLFELCGQLIGSTFVMKKIDEDRPLSSHYIDMDGQNLSVASTGTRLLMTMLGICMDEAFTSILIDEPELGLSPRVQQAVSSFFHDESQRMKYFPHLQQIYIATHSHLFLDRTNVSNNYIVSKEGPNIEMSQIDTVSGLHRLQFNLLGNSLEALFLPSAIVVVEGKTDCEYLERIVQLKFPSRRITVMGAGGDVKKKVVGLREVFGELHRSPFKNRIFVVLDSIHQPGLAAELVARGIDSNNIIVWDRNGIEFVYPASLMRNVFVCGESSLGDLKIEGDLISLNGITKNKNALKNEILASLDSSTSLPSELETKLLEKLSVATSA
jgi:predicted ATPase